MSGGGGSRDKRDPCQQMLSAVGKQPDQSMLLIRRNQAAPASIGQFFIEQRCQRIDFRVLVRGTKQNRTGSNFQPMTNQRTRGFGLSE